MGYTYKTKVIVILIAGFAWFVFGTLMVIRGSKNADDLTTVSGRLLDFKITQVTKHSTLNIYDVPVLEFVIENTNERLGLYLNSRESYEPLIDKIKDKDKIIKISYLDSWKKTEEGINLHIYNIDYGESNLINIDKKKRTDKKVGIILYCVGLLFISTIFIAKRQEKNKKAAANNV